MIRALSLDDGRPWFAVRDYPARVRDVTIEIAADGSHIEAYLGIDRGSNKLAWMTRHASGVGMIFTPWRHPALPDLPRRYPTAWRPLIDVAFPHPVPLPLTAPIVAAAPPVDIAPAAPTETDGWPYPHLVLTCGPPASVDEAEARVLRALRTVEAGPRVGHAYRATSGDFSPEWHAVMRKFYDEEAGDPARIGDVRALFQPTRRDFTDVATALGWLHAVADRPVVRVFRMRAADPAWSFAQIAEHDRRWASRAAVHRAYQSACIRICRHANRSPAS